MSRVSVIIPVYNAEKYIKEAIESVLHQTYKEFELIVIDDGSTDRSGQIVQNEFKQAAHYLYQPNAGAARARNMGVRQATGEYIAFLDADDLWAPQKLEMQVSILDERNEVGLVHCDAELIDYMGQHVRFSNDSNSKDSYAQQFLGGHVIGTWASLIRREIFEKAGGFDEDFKGAGYEDLEFSIRLSRLCRIHCIDKPLVKHRDHPESSSYDESRGLDNLNVFLVKMMNRFGNDPIHKRFLVGEQGKYLSSLGKYLIKKGKMKEGRRKLVRSIVLSAQALELKVAFRASIRLVYSFLKFSV